MAMSEDEMRNEPVTYYDAHIAGLVIGVSYTAADAEAFVAWLNANGHHASIVWRTEDTVGGNHDHETINALWEAYCND